MISVEFGKVVLGAVRRKARATSGRLTDCSRRLRQDTSGLAMIEFALSMPALIALSFGGIQTADFTLTHMRASQIALMVADNAGRVRTELDETDIDEVMIAARIAGEGIKLGTKGRIILSSVEANGQSGSNAGQTIRWQRCFGMKNVSSSYGAEGEGATSSALASGVGPTGKKITAPSGSAAMFVEFVYDYEPVVPEYLFSPKTIRYTAAYTKREGTPAYPTNLANLPNNKKRLCSNFSAT